MSCPPGEGGGSQTQRPLGVALSHRPQFRPPDPALAAATSRRICRCSPRTPNTGGRLTGAEAAWTLDVGEEEGDWFLSAEVPSRRSC